MPVIDVTPGLSGPIGPTGPIALSRLLSLVGLRGLRGLAGMTGLTGSPPWAPGLSTAVRIGVLAAAVPLAAAASVVAERRARCRR